ncbi:MAG: hypothetical protein AB7N70_34870 [Dehalococcoidia bacterium]
MMHARSYTQDTLGPCAVCWREVRHGEPCVWHTQRRTWLHTTCIRVRDRRAVALAA